MTNDMKYRIMFDYGMHEGKQFLDEVEYDTVDEAVKEAIACNSAFPFIIVSVIDWKATI